MSRVEPKQDKDQPRQAEQRGRDSVDRTPSKAEGEESTVNDALRNEESAD